MAKAWSALRLALYHNKCAKYLTITTITAIKKRALKGWSSLLDPNQVKGRALHKKLLKLTSLHGYFNSIKLFSKIDKAHTEKVQPLKEKRLKR